MPLAWDALEVFHEGVLAPRVGRVLLDFHGLVANDVTFREVFSGVRRGSWNFLWHDPAHGRLSEFDAGHMQAFLGKEGLKLGQELDEAI